MRYDIAYPTVLRMRLELCHMNYVPAVARYMGLTDRYKQMRLELAKRVCGTRPEFFVDNQAACQAVLDTIDALFMAKG